MSEFWTPEPLLADATVFCLAGGASLQHFDFERLAGRRCIAINQSAYAAPRDILYFTDNSWFDDNEALIRDWPGLVVTTSRAAKAALPALRRVDYVPSPHFLVGQPQIRRGRSSGQTAISLAIAMRARRVVLLGYDMRLVDGRSHWHEAYSARDPNVYRDEFLPPFTGWHITARAVGCEVVNATPGSALTEFPMVDIEDELAC